MKLTKRFNEFFNSEKAGGIILVFVTVISLILANSQFQQGYINFWNIDLGSHTLVQWINDGLMAIFFLLIGLELEREIYKGELSDIKNASLPIIGAVGGMVLPAAIYLGFNFGTETQSGAGIPMATDIAFAIGILSLLGNRVPASLKVFLTALAVIDDLGAILIIAIFYTTSISFLYLALAFGVLAILFTLNRFKIYNLLPYIIGGVIMWYFMLNSGVHATITGVLLAFVIPFRKGKKNSPSYKLEHFLHKPVAFLILPLFAISNTAIAIGDNWITGLTELSSIGIIAGLVIGKPLGIWLFSFIGTKIKLCSLPEELSWNNIVGTGFLAGIGFTMSIFITLLAFNSPSVIDNSKISIMLASLVAGAIGFISLKLTLKKKPE